MEAPACDLVVENLQSGYNNTRIVDGLTFSVPRGGKLGLLGRNGVGKTTTLASIMGLADIQGGRITFGSVDVTTIPTWRRSRAGMGYVPQTRDIFKSLTVEENLLSAVRTSADQSRVSLAYELFPRLRERRNNNGTQLSGGEQQMLAVARAIIPGPSLLLMDEPLEGLAPKLRDELMDALQDLIAKTALTCILVEQHVDVVLNFADQILILERGRMAFLGDTDQLKSDSTILDRTVGLNKH